MRNLMSIVFPIGEYDVFISYYHDDDSNESSNKTIEHKNISGLLKTRD